MIRSKTLRKMVTSTNKIAIILYASFFLYSIALARLRAKDYAFADFRLNDVDNDNIPGRAGIDYPVYHRPPTNTSFRCRDYDFAGYFGDPEAGCQGYHVCFPDGRNASFLCVNGTVFHQRYFVCDWWFNFNCTHAPSLYELNLFRKIPLPVLPPVTRRPFVLAAPVPKVAYVSDIKPGDPDRRKPLKEEKRVLEPVRKPRGNPVANVTRKRNPEDCKCTCDNNSAPSLKYLEII